MKSRPLDASLGARRCKHPFGEVVRIEQRPDGRGERRLVVGRPERPEAVRQVERDQQIASGVAGFQRADDESGACAATHTLADLDVRPIAVEHQVPSLQRERLRAPVAASSSNISR
ncbi:MAG: hypothetical protein ACLPV4_18275 [Solirubrobacteraceae bacterium]